MATQIFLKDFVPHFHRNAANQRTSMIAQEGTAVFVDVVRFTRMTEELIERHGRKLGAELLYGRLQNFFSGILDAGAHFGGTSVAFAGDAVTLFFSADDFGGAEDAAHRAAMVATKIAKQFEDATRISIASGTFLRKVTGSDALSFLELFGGSAAQTLAELDTLPERPSIVASEAVKALLAAKGIGVESFGVAGAYEIQEVPPCKESALGTKNETISETDAIAWVPLTLRGVAYSLCAERSDVARFGLDAVAQIRTVVALFVHIRGLQYSAASDQEHMQQLVSHVQSVVIKQGGTVLGLNSDAKGSYVSAVFGAPVGHENDALRAVLAGESIAQFAKARDIDVGVGVARGSALSGIFATSGRARYDITGKPMSHAARLMVAAVTHEVLVANAVSEDLTSHFTFEDSPDSTARRLVGRNSFEHKSSPGTLRCRIVGRRSEISEIENSLLAGAGAKVVIEALPGIGKSALLSQVQEAFKLRYTCWLVSSGEEISRDLPYHSWRRLSASILEHDNGALSEEGKGVVEWLAYARNKLPDSVSEVHGPERGAMIAGLVATALSELAARDRVILCFDDAQWMDTPSVALLHGVVKAGAPIAILLAKRPEPPSTMEAVMLYGAPDVKTLELQPLGQDGVIEIACQQLKADSLSPDLKKLIIEKSGGSPLFAVQIGRALLEQGYVTHEGGHCMFAAGQRELDHVDFLESVEGAILARVDALADTTKRVAAAASVHGRTFSQHAVEIALGVELPPDAVAQELQTLEAEGYIAVEETGALNVFSFSHALVQEAIGESMTSTLRRDMNQRLSKWWAMQSGPEAIQRRARHLTQSLSPEESDPEVLARVIEALEAAAHQAASETANLEASQFHQQALGVVERLPNTEHWRRKCLHLRVSKAYSLSLVRGYGDPTVEEAYRAALEFSETVDHKEDLVFTLYGLFSFYASRGDYSDSAPILSRIKALSESSRDPKMPSFLHHTEAIQSVLTGRIVEGTKLARRSIDEAAALGDGMFFSHSGAGDWRIYSGSWEALGRAVQGQWQAALAAHDEATHLGATDHFARAFVSGFAPLPVLAGAPRASLEYAEALVTDADTRGFALFSIIGRIYLGWAAAKLGMKDERVAAFLGGQLQISQAMKLDSFNPYFLALAAEAHLAIGEPALAREKVNEALSAIKKCGASAFLPEVLRAEAQVQYAEALSHATVLNTLNRAINLALGDGAVHFAFLAAHEAKRLKVGTTSTSLEELADLMRKNAFQVKYDGPLSQLWVSTQIKATSDA